MALRLSEILEHDAPHLSITGRKDLLAFYDALKAALKEGRLTPEGGALPTSRSARRTAFAMTAGRAGEAPPSASLPP